MNKYDTVSSKKIFENPWWEYRVDEYIHPNNETGEYHYVFTYGSTFVIPEIQDNTFVLTRQYRYLNRKESIEFPGGGLKKGYSSIQNALEELEEETGYSTKNIVKIGEFNPYNGVTSEICEVFRAKDLIKGNPNPEPTEEIEVLILTENEIIKKISKGEIWDGMTLSAWSLFYFLKNSRH